MKREALFWLAGGALSLAFHVGLSALLDISVEPDAVEMQDVPEARLEMTAYEVQRTEVRDNPVQGEQVPSGEARQTALSQDAIPRVTAKPQQLPQSASVAVAGLNAAVLGATQPSGTVLESAPPKAPAIAGEPLPAAEVSVEDQRPDATVATKATGTIVEPTRADPTVVMSAQAAVSRLSDTSKQQISPLLLASLSEGPRSEAIQPRFDVLPDVQPDRSDFLQDIQPNSGDLLPDVQPDKGDTLPDIQPDSDALLQNVKPDSSDPLLAYRPVSPPSQPVETGDTTVVSDPLPSASAPAQPAPSQLAQEEAPSSLSKELPPQTPPSEFATASLAWSGGTKTSFDPASLAAIQSFMTEGDLASTQSNAGSVRDGIAAMLSQVPCSRLQVAFVPATGSLELRGHVPEEGLREPVLAALRAQMGGSIPVVDNLLILPRPQCGALSGIGSVGLPQSTDQLTNPLLVGEDAHAQLYRYTRGERLTFDLTAPDYDAYIYVDYFDADGMVIHLVPNDRVFLEIRRAKSNVSIGVDRADGNFLAVTIGPPYGQEIAVAFAASEPLYEGVRPTVEPAVAYLDWLRDQIAKARSANPDFKGEWVYFFVSTAKGG